MDLATFSFGTTKGWSEAFPQMDGPKTLVLAFGASDFSICSRPLEELREAFPQASLLGCSTSGEILGAQLHDDSIVVAVLRFQSTELRLAKAAIQDPEASRKTGEALGNSLSGPGLKAVLVFSDGLGVNGNHLALGLSATLPKGVVVTGGLAGDKDRFKSTWVMVAASGEPTRPASAQVAAVGLYGEDLQVGYGSKGGWDSFGIERRVTRSVGNVVYEFDGKPALALYKTYLGERAAGLPATALLFPLTMRSEEGGEDQVVRTILAVDEANQSLTFAGDIPEGARVQLMRCNLDRLISGASDAAGQIGSMIPGPALSIAISCVGRRLVLGQRVEEELESALDMLPTGVQQVGFYSYGELSPTTSGSCRLHNQTMTLTTIQEA